jgi:hypothetical protein
MSERNSVRIIASNDVPPSADGHEAGRHGVITLAGQTHAAGRRWAHGSADVTVAPESVHLSQDASPSSNHPTPNTPGDVHDGAGDASTKPAPATTAARLRPRIIAVAVLSAKPLAHRSWPTTLTSPMDLDHYRCVVRHLGGAGNDATAGTAVPDPVGPATFVGLH